MDLARAAGHPAGEVSAPRVLVLNVGSSSVRYRLLEPAGGETLAAGHVEHIGSPAARHTHRVGDVDHDVDHDVEPDAGTPGPGERGLADHDAALAAALGAFERLGPRLDDAGLAAVGHRVVHGGTRFTGPVLVDDDVVAAIAALAPLAPLHNPFNVAGIETARRAFPGLPQVAVFDTAFHHTLPAEALTYAVPQAWRAQHGVRRYGFHGSSYAHVTRRAATRLGRHLADLGLVVLHLGNGASACAVQGGASIDTSMGFSPLEGLVMGTRSGDVDPALGAYLDRVAGIHPHDYDAALNHASGLKGLSGHADLRDLLAAREAGDEDAALAFDVMVHRLRKYVGGYAVLLDRFDGLVFTGGIGEHSPQVRSALVRGLHGLGLELDEPANAAGPPERRVTTPRSRVPAWVVPTNEELEIARACLTLLDRAGGAPRV